MQTRTFAIVAAVLSSVLCSCGAPRIQFKPSTVAPTSKIGAWSRSEGPDLYAPAMNKLVNSRDIARARKDIDRASIHQEVLRQFVEQSPGVAPATYYRIKGNEPGAVKDSEGRIDLEATCRMLGLDAMLYLEVRPRGDQVEDGWGWRWNVRLRTDAFLTSLSDGSVLWRTTVDVTCDGKDTVTSTIQQCVPKLVSRLIKDMGPVRPGVASPAVAAAEPPKPPVAPGAAGESPTKPPAPAGGAARDLSTPEGRLVGYWKAATPTYDEKVGSLSTLYYGKIDPATGRGSYVRLGGTPVTGTYEVAARAPDDSIAVTLRLSDGAVSRETLVVSRDGTRLAITRVGGDELEAFYVYKGADATP